MASVACLAATCREAGVVQPTARFAPVPAVKAPHPSAPAGSVVGGYFQDGSYPIGVPVPEGWVAHPGEAQAPLRVVLEHVSTQATLGVWVFHESPTAPRPLAGCTWTFSDVGAHETLRTTSTSEIATCVPTDPDSPLVLGTYLVREALAFHFELEVPPGRLLQGRRAVEPLLQGVRFY